MASESRPLGKVEKSVTLSNQQCLPHPCRTGGVVSEFSLIHSVSHLLTISFAQHCASTNRCESL